MQPSDISILIVEDQTLMRQGLKTILDLEPGMRVVGEAKDGAEGVREALRLRPDVILMDVQMPVMNGVDAIRAIIGAWPQARVIVLTTFDRDDYVFQSIRAGAMGYLLKDAPADTLIQTIRRVHAGDVSSSRRSPRARYAKWQPAGSALKHSRSIYRSVSARCWCCWRRG